MEFIFNFSLDIFFILKSKDKEWENEKNHIKRVKWAYAQMGNLSKR